MTDATKLPPLPEPFDYCYEWDGPYGTRKFSAASHNGRKPERSVPLFNADQMHAYAEAASDLLLANVEALHNELFDARRQYDIQTGAYKLRGDRISEQETEIEALRKRAEDAERALGLAKVSIVADREALFLCHVNPVTGTVDDEHGQDGLSDYDTTLAAIDAAIKGTAA